MIPNPHESLVDVSNQLFELIVDELGVTQLMSLEEMTM